MEFYLAHALSQALWPLHPIMGLSLAPFDSQPEAEARGRWAEGCAGAAPRGAGLELCRQR